MKTANKDSNKKEIEIFDSILFSGFYSEDFQIKGKLPYTLRSRTVEEVMDINQEVENGEFKTQSAALDAQLFAHLSYALSSYNGEQLSKLTPEKRRDFLKKLPAPIMRVLTTQMAKFDKEVSDACTENEENFSETPGQEQG